jgi:tetratricopeptide (TPR) repeat protein
VIRKRVPRWQSAAERARVAAELIEEAESLAETSTIASPADVARDGLPPPIRAELPTRTAVSEPGLGGIGPEGQALAVPAPLEAALAAEPDNVALLLERAARLAHAGHQRAAQLDYEHALRVAPAHGEALTGLGVLLSRRGLWGEAVRPLRRATEVDAGRAAAWYHLGEALNHVDDLAGAQIAYERTVELEPRNARALHRLGIVLDRLNRPDEATRMYRRAREAAAR